MVTNRENRENHYTSRMNADVQQLEKLARCPVTGESAHAGQSNNVTGNVVRWSHPTLLIELAADIELFHTPDHEAFATFQVDDHFETWPLKAKSFRRWLARGFHEQTRAAYWRGELCSVNPNDVVKIINGNQKRITHGDAY